MLLKLTPSSRSRFDFSNSNYNYDNTNTNVSSHLCNIYGFPFETVIKEEDERYYFT